MLILGIETSCDETAVALVENGKNILVSLVASQAELHSLYGGVVPEVASRRQLELINPLISELRERSGGKWKNVGAVAVTTSPGLIGSLLIGLSAASAISYVKNIPLFEVDHVEAHLYANFLDSVTPYTLHLTRKLRMPFIGLVVSGGHTSLFLVKGHRHIELLGATRDDAAGEAFDKVAKLLGLPYPGGPVIEKLAQKGNPEKIDFPRPYLHGSHDFSFSGLKTAVAYYIRDTLQKSNCKLQIVNCPKGTSSSQIGKPANQQTSKLTNGIIANVAAGFQQAVAETIVYKTVKAAEKKGIKRIAAGGGVAANKKLRELLEAETKKRGIELHIPPVRLCLDNAAMIAARAYYRYSVR